MLQHRYQTIGAIVAIGSLALIVIGVSLVLLGPMIGNVFQTPVGNEYCVAFFRDGNENGQQEAGEQAIQIPGAQFKELHGQQVYATYAADACAPMAYVDFAVQVMLPNGYRVTASDTQNQNGHYDDKHYVFKFGVQLLP